MEEVETGYGLTGDGHVVTGPGATGGAFKACDPDALFPGLFGEERRASPRAPRGIPAREDRGPPGIFARGRHGNPAAR